MFIEKIRSIFKIEKDNKQSHSADKLAIEYALEGETERKLGNYQNAIKNIDIAINMEPDNDLYYITRALIYKARGSFDEALKDINKALELNPDIDKSKSIKDEILSCING